MGSVISFVSFRLAQLVLIMIPVKNTRIPSLSSPFSCRRSFCAQFILKLLNFGVCPLFIPTSRMSNFIMYSFSEGIHKIEILTVGMFQRIVTERPSSKLLAQTFVLRRQLYAFPIIQVG